MLVNCEGDIYCQGMKLKQVHEFKYLGVMVRDDTRSPEQIILDRISATRKSFSAIRSRARLFGINNCRVRAQLVQTLAVTNLMFGCLVYACLSDLSLVLKPSHRIWVKAETLLRHMLRWALYAPVDIRVSFLYMASNCPTLQVLVWKRCYRYFKGLADHPRFVSRFGQAVCSQIDSQHIGPSTFYYWGQVDDSFMGSLTGVKSIYQVFRDLLSCDLAESQRLQQLGLSTVVQDIISYCFQGDASLPPAVVRTELEGLHGGQHSIIMQPDRAGVQVPHIHPWPSWLSRGGKRIVDFFFQFFYRQQAPEHPSQTRQCRLCQNQIDTPWWKHVFSPCPGLASISEEQEWQHFASLIIKGYSGLAMYACFPVFYRFYSMLAEHV